jgi:hypothetical protein
VPHCPGSGVWVVGGIPRGLRCRPLLSCLGDEVWCRAVQSAACIRYTFGLVGGRLTQRAMLAWIRAVYASGQSITS